jgi:4-alpha-glucanotransferase
LHPTSLPSPHAIGDLGPEARRFVDWLEAAGQSIWQVLPLGPTGYGDSPYQCFSAFAGNTLLVSVEDMVEDGWVLADELAGAPEATGASDFNAARAFKGPLLQAASERFQRNAGALARQEFEHFCTHNAEWLEDYALFRALKARFDERPWTGWDAALVRREPGALGHWRRECEREVHAERFAQWQFFVQWGRLHERCRAAGIHLMGDVPIFVAHDSADVWAHPDLFRLLPDGRPEVIAGVPPDYFSATGQCWGNPLYRWDVLERHGYAWWVARFRQALATVDWIRVDHFRGFEAFWEIPGADTTAVNGRWVKAPGRQLFEAVRRALGDLPIVAENLGVITPEVEALREDLGFPGMAILQFAFGGDPQAPGFRPHNYTRDLVAYTGSHDNDTTVGWWNSTGTGDSTRAAEAVAAEKRVASLYLATDGGDVHWAMIRTLLASVADVAMVPVQDVLGLGSEARMNLPARASGNWGWRLARGALTPELAERLRALAQVFGRAPAV